MTFALYFGGGESPAWRKRLLEHGVSRISLNFTDLQNRLPKTKEWHLADHFPPEVRLGLYWSPKDWSRAEEIAFARAYRTFAEDEYERLTWATDFRHTGPSWGIPLWDEKERPEVLLRDAEDGLVAVTGKQLEGRKARSFRANIRSLGGALLGIGVSAPEQMQGLVAATSTSYISATRYGEFVIWDGARLRRFNAKAKPTERPRYRAAIAASGVDYGAVVEDDKEAVVSLTLWSWQQMENDMVSRRVRPTRFEDDPEEGSNLSTTFDPGLLVPIVDDQQDLVGTSARVGGSSRAIEHRETTPLPILSIGSKTVVDADGAETVSVIASLGQHSLRRCDSCSISDKCPGYQRGFSCAYDIPIEVRTKDQLNALLTGVLEMQAQRVLFTRMAEELEGGYPDPTLSGEVDRLFRLTEQYKAISDNRDFINIQVEAKAKGGILSRLFGDHVGEATRALPSGGIDASSTDALLAHDLGIVDAEVVEDVVDRSDSDAGGTAHTHQGDPDA